MKVKIKKLRPEAVMPTRAHITDAGFDLTAVSYEQDKYGCHVYGFGLAMEIPLGYVGLIFPRSSVAKYNVALTNCVGVVDSGYRGEVMAKFKDAQPELETTILTHPRYKIGDRVAQIVFIQLPPTVLCEVKALADSDRGDGGYGSTGK